MRERLLYGARKLGVFKTWKERIDVREKTNEYSLKKQMNILWKKNMNILWKKMDFFLMSDGKKGQKDTTQLCLRVSFSLSHL